MLKTRKKRFIQDSPVVELDQNKSKKLKTDLTITASAMLENISEHEFSADDFAHLSKNENWRYLNNSTNIGHAVIKKTDLGKIARQYPIPQSNSNHSPHVLPLQDIEAIERFGQVRFKAKAEDGTNMYAKRVLDIEYQEGDHQETLQIACFSPTHDEQEPFWGGGDNIAIFRDDLTEEEKQDLNKELQELPQVTKGGQELAIDHASVKYRDANRTRTPDQNTVMGRSAVNEFEELYDSRKDEWSNDMKTVLTRAISAPLRDQFKSNYRPEWCHREGFSLTPINLNPQRENNLGAAPKWANTEMMVPERIAKWFALNRPHASIKIKPIFTMFLDSDVIKTIDFAVTISEHKRSVKFKLSLNSFKKYPIFRKASDLAQATAIAYDLLQGTTPTNEQKILENNNKISPAISSAPIAVPGRSTSVSNLFQSTSLKQSKSKNVFPTHLEYEKSIVQISTTSHEPDYDEPWIGTHVVDNYSSGTGLVIAHQNKKYILTNAHCVENAIIVRVRLANNRKKKYEAKQKCVSYQCDLALLEVNHPDFDALAESIELGEMIHLRDKVQTVGFPMGGSEISVSKGIVSRIEVRDYCMSALNMLQVQVDAAINPGNSGGPVFSDGKVVGIAFQGYDRQGLGYMIPIPIIQHFLKEALTEKHYRGFPILPVEFQTLENPALRKYYGMQEDQTGVRINKIDYLCDAYSKLKPDDILLEIDSLSISNEGTVDIAGIGNCIDFIHVTHMKYIGDTVNLKILRKNSETKEATIQNIVITLDRAPLETEKVPQTEHDKVPTYYIASGISFIPLSRNYLEGRGAELEEIFILEESCLLSNIPKKSPNDQFIVINSILDCEENQGYEDYENSIVKEINSKPINNIHDVIAAIEGNRNDMHQIITSSKKVIVVKNMSPSENDALLKRYMIHKDRSIDLEAPRFIQEQPLKDSNHKKLSTNHVKLQKQLEILGADDEGTPSIADSDESETDAETNVREITKKDLGISDMTPGSQKFLAKVTELEGRYKNFPIDQDIEIGSEDDLSDLDFEGDGDTNGDESSLTGSSSDDTNLEKELLNANKKQPSRSRLIKSSEKFGLFDRNHSQSVEEVIDLNQRSKNKRHLR